MATVMVTLSLSSTGCATVSSLNQSYSGPHRGPVVMSGTRLNLDALTDRAQARDRFQVEPPRYPLADLPFSFALDFLVLPATLVTAAVRQACDNRH